MISPQPQPIPTLIQRPPYYIYPRPVVSQPNVAIAGPGYAGAGLAVAPQIGAHISLPGLPPVGAQVGGNIQLPRLPFVPHPAVSIPLIRRQLIPIPAAMIIPPNRRIFAVRRSVSHDQSGIEQIGTGNNILQGNVQQIQLGSKKSKRRGLFCENCLNFTPSESNLFGVKRNIATAINPLEWPRVLAQN